MLTFLKGYGKPGGNMDGAFCARWVAQSLPNAGKMETAHSTNLGVPTGQKQSSDNGVETLVLWAWALERNMHARLPEPLNIWERTARSFRTKAWMIRQSWNRIR